MELEALYNKWGNKVVTGEEPAPYPSLLGFINTVPGLEMLHSHIIRNSKIAVHCDVDVDGIGSGFIVKQLLINCMSLPQLYVINSDKQHGIQQKHVDYFRNNPIDLLIIVDSSSNELEYIKKFNCDVLVIDHHEVEHTEFIGETEDGHKFIIINNVIDNLNNSNINDWIQETSKTKLATEELIQPYTADDRMSCGLVIYELFRVYSLAYGLGKFLENKMLYQWACVTLYTDAILMNTLRNQWYAEKTIHSTCTEPSLMIMIQKLNKFAASLSKSIIGYTLAPTINRAIRAGASGEALSIVLDSPSNIEYLNKYRPLQDETVSLGISDLVTKDSYILKDITDTAIHKNYCGVIGSRLSGDFNKNVIVYRVTDGIAEGSFRGRESKANYLEYFKNYDSTTWAQGHKAAFGFRAPVEKLDDIMNSLVTVESCVSNKPYLTAGNIPEYARGEYHITDFEAFKKEGGLWKLSLANSKLSSDEQVVITVHSSDMTLKEVRGKLYVYEVLGMECKAFKEMQSEFMSVYAEFSKSIELYLK